MISRRKYLIEAANFLSRFTEDERSRLFERVDVSQYRNLDDLREAVEVAVTGMLPVGDQLVLEPENILDMEDLTEIMIFTALSSTLDLRKLLNRLPQDVMTDDLLARFIEAQPYLPLDIWKQLPDRFHTEPVIRALLDKAALPIGDVPRGYLTRDYVLARVPLHIDEVRDVPKGMMDREMAASLVERNIDLVLKVPAKCRSEAMLYAWLVGDGRCLRHNPQAERETFDLFPKAMWSQRVVAQALRLGLLTSEDNIRSRHLDETGAAWLLIRNPSADVPEELLTDKTVGEAVARSPLVLSRIKAKQMTEPVVFAALSNWAGSSRAGLLADLPRDVFSRRCWEAGVGHLFGLDAVPEEHQDDQMIGAAIARDPRNVIRLSDPAEWMNENGEDVLAAVSGPDWTDQIEDVGIVRMGRHWVDVRDLKSKPLEDGGSYVVLKSNKGTRVFLLDGGQVLGRFVVRNGKVETTCDLAPIRREVAEVLETEGIDADITDLHDHGIYPEVVIGDFKRTTRSKQHLRWSEIKHGDDVLYLGWLRLTEEPVIRIATGLRGEHRVLKSAEVMGAPGNLVPAAREIISFLHEKRVPAGWSRSLQQAGVGSRARHSEWVLLADKKIAEIDGVTVYRHDRTISLFGEPHGLIAFAHLDPDGSVGNVELDYDFREGETGKAAEAALRSISGKYSDE